MPNYTFDLPSVSGDSPLVGDESHADYDNAVEVFFGGDVVSIACTYDVYWVICNLWPTLDGIPEPSMSQYQWMLLELPAQKTIIKHILAQDKYRLVPTYILNLKG